MQTIIYKSSANVDIVTTINNSQKVLTKAAWIETIPEKTVQLPQEHPDPNDPETTITANVDEVIPEQIINHPGEKNILSGQPLVDWFIANQMIEAGFDITQYFLIPDGAPVPIGKEVTNVNYDNGTWDEVAPVITADMVRAECKRRMILLFGARDDDDLDNKISNGNMESNHLLQKENDDPGNWDPLTDGVRKTALMAAYDGMVALRSASNVLEASLPADFTDDIHWP